VCPPPVKSGCGNSDPDEVEKAPVRTPSVKGSLMVGAVVTVRRLRDKGLASAETLAARLPKEALELLDQKIEIARWYPVSAFCALIDLDWEIAGHRAPAYLERQGAITADRLFDAKIYQQLEFAERSAKVDTREGLVRGAKLITTITGTFYDFLTFGVRVGDDQLEVVYGNATAFGDPLIHTTVGFMDQINQRQGSKRRWSGRRDGADRVVFTMELPERLTA
jgi:hypothetical protein